MTRLWMVRLGKFGEQEAHALETGELVTGWSGLRDFSANPVREEIAGAVEETYKEQKAGTLQNWAVQLNQLANSIKEGDLVVVPLKTTSQLAIGRVKGRYTHTPAGSPMRCVEWLQTDLPRDSVKQDLL